MRIPLAVNLNPILTEDQLGDEERFSRNYVIGLILAISSCFFIGASFIIKKVGLLRLTGQGQRRAGAGGYGYLRQWIWWCGLISMGVGEAFNFAAYAFAPASLVTPLGALSVLITAILASRYLDEKMNVISKLGCVLCITGSTMIVLHAPKEGEILSLQHLGTMIMSPGFLFYLCVVVSGSTFLIACVAPRYGNQNVVVYVLICSLIGSLSVMCCKGIGIAINVTLSGGENNFRHALFYFLVTMVLITISIQMNYLNKALDIFDTSIVTPIYYVFFTTFVLIASAILFEEWKRLSVVNVLGTLAGFITVIIGVFMLNSFKEANVNLNWNKTSLKTVKYQQVSTCEDQRFEH